MGTLRLEPKTKPMDPELYSELRAILLEAERASTDSRTYWDLDEEEIPKQVRRDFLHVAEREHISLTVRRSGSSLELRFAAPQETGPRRISAAEARQRILDALTANGGPLKKSEILDRTGVPGSTWNLRIKELIGDGSVTAQGERRGRQYSVV